MGRLFDISKPDVDEDRRERGAPKLVAPGRTSRPGGTEQTVARVDAHLVSLVSPESVEAEQYRGLRYVVEQMRKPDVAPVVGVCSPTPGDGKSVTAINLAGSLAQDPKARVLLIEVDLRRPSVTIGDHLALRDPAGRGLVDAILDPSVTLADVTQHLRAFNLAVVPAGGCPSAPYEVLKSPRLGEVLAQARRMYDYLILDAPPVVPVPDCRLISRWIDGFLMVVAAHRTPRAALEEALNLLGTEKVLGLVFNGHDRFAKRYYGYGQGYGHKDGENRQRWWSKRRGRKST